MPTFLSGLPVHPLVVHAVVVLVPAAVLGCLVVALWPAARRRWGIAVVVVTALAAVSVPLATSSGEGLEHQLPRTPDLATHAELGDQLLVVVGPLLVLVAALVVLDLLRRRDTAGGPGTTAAPRGGLSGLTGSRVLTGVVSALTVVLAVVSAVQVVRIGDSGARAAWGSVQYTPQPRPTGPQD